jgi:hypothetical protein
VTSDAFKMREFYKDDLAEAFDDGCRHLHCFFLNLEKSPTSILEMNDVIEAKRLKEVYPYVDIALRIFLCTAASSCSAERFFPVL